MSGKQIFMKGKQISERISQKYVPNASRLPEKDKSINLNAKY